MKNTNMNTGAASLSDERERAAITACALMIKGICLTTPNAEWTERIENRIHYLLRQIATTPQADAAPSELASMTRMFHAACADLGAINEALGLDPDDGGAAPILDAIAELKSERDKWVDAGYAASANASQADAAPIGMHVAALLAARDWLTDSNSPHALRNQIDAAIAAGGAQEAVTDTKSKLPEFSGCIEWSNYRNRQGYGSFKADGKMSLAHRVMYCDYHGVTRDSIKHLVVRHACDNPSCFNPAHLLLGTHADNTKDKIERGRHARGEMNGQSKLSRHQAGQIRSLYVRGSREFGIPALAKKFGVGQSTIREVVLNLRWVETTPSNGEHGS